MAVPNTSSVYETVFSTSKQISNSSNRTALLVRVDSTNYPLSVFYWSIFVVGLTGNILLISINIWRRSSKQLTTQLFMISLAVSDLGLLLGNTWIQAYTSASSNFIFGSFMCKFTKLWAFAASCSSALTLAIIGIDRYLSITKPGNGFFSLYGALAMIASAWIIVISAGIPGFIWTDVVTSGQLKACQVPASINPDMVNNYIVVTRIAIFFAPLGVTIFSYFGIWYKLIFSNKKAKKSNKTEQDQKKNSRKAAKMCTLVVAAFAITWTPFHTDRLYYSYGPNKTLANILFAPALALAHANTCINPIIYGFMWKPMKDTLMQLFGRLLKIRTVAGIMSRRSTKVNPSTKLTSSIIVQSHDATTEH